MALPTVEEVQSSILKTLDASPSGTIDDSRKLAVSSTSLGSQEAQILVKSALDSLQSKEVGLDLGGEWRDGDLRNGVCPTIS